MLGIFEADPRTPQGALFDLQVHLRSGRVAGLLDPDRVRTTLLESGLTNVRQMNNVDREDPFQREYVLWLGEVGRR